MFVARGGVVLRGDGGENCGVEDDRLRRRCFGGGVFTRRSGDVGHMEKKRTLPLLLPPCDSVSGVVDDGGDGDGDYDNDGIARSKGGDRRKRRRCRR